MKYLVSWSKHETGDFPVKASSMSDAALHFKKTCNKARLITGVTEIIDGKEGDYRSIDEWCESCGNPIFEGEPYASDGEVFLCQKCK